MRYQIIRQRKNQRKMLARAIRDIRSLSDNVNKKDSLLSLLQVASNYPKLRDKKS